MKIASKSFENVQIHIFGNEVTHKNLTQPAPKLFLCLLYKKTNIITN
jgi:hypothetical protein